jgi:hypothetical protein
MVGRWRFYPPTTTPNRLDIVWCRFPESELLDPGPKARPGLIRRVVRHPVSSHVGVEIAYGTSNLKLDRALAHQLIIAHPFDLVEAGLRYPTRFDLTLTKLLPWSEEFFVPLRGGADPVIGRLSAINRMDLAELAKTLPARK